MSTKQRDAKADGDEKHAYNLGARACEEGGEDKVNPYSPETENHKSWEHGYLDLQKRRQLGH